MLEVFGCEILINAVHLRQAVWEQGDENYKNVELRVTLWEEVPYRMNCPLIEI
jgi:Alcohol dehydrogenase transcription factor Myb/SANT-like.